MDGSTNEMILALAQVDLAKGDVERNVAMAGELAAEAAAGGASLLLLPELWSTAYDLERATEHARSSRAIVLPAIEKLAREHELYIAGSVLLDDERGEGPVFNTAIICGPGGWVGDAYRKIHLFGPMNETDHLAAGDAPVVCTLPWGDVGLAICYDLRFPELFRMYADRGVALLLLPAEWPAVRQDHWNTLVRARAIENQCFVAACNRVGVTDGTEFRGGSMVVGPWGETVIAAHDREGIHFATIDISAVNAARSRLPVLADRRPDIYGMAALHARQPGQSEERW